MGKGDSTNMKGDLPSQVAVVGLGYVGLRSASDPFADAPSRFDAVVLGVPHGVFREKGLEPHLALLRDEDGRGVLVDVKGVLSWVEDMNESDSRVLYWSL